jgi:starch phosphorylase
VAALQPRHDPWQRYHADAELRRALDMIRDGAFSPQQPDLFRPVVDSLLAGGDKYLLLADYRSYVDCQDRVDDAWRDSTGWGRRSIHNVAGMGKFSTDRTIREYARDIWGIRPIAPDR